MSSGLKDNQLKQTLERNLPQKGLGISPTEQLITGRF